MNYSGSGERLTASQVLALDHITELYDFSGDTSCIDPSTLQAYNLRIKSSVDDYNQRRKISIDDLPNELLIAIIQDVVANAPRPWSCQTPLLLSLVDHRWADLILQTPSFWTKIDLTSNIEDLEATTALQLELSGDHSLALIYQGESDIICHTAHLLQPHLHRVTHLYLQLFGKDAGTDPFFPRTMFISLREISIMTVSYTGIAEFLSRHEAFAPYIDLVANGHFELTLQEKDLVSIDFCLSSTAVIKRVEDITTLKQVSMNRGYSPPEGWSIILEERDTLLSWEVLEVDFVPWRVTHGLLSRCASLISLTLPIDGRDAGALLNVIPCLVSLECIDISFHTGIMQDMVAAVSDTSPKETRIRTMSVVLRFDEPITKTTTNFVHLLLRMSPRLESFALSGQRGKMLDFTEIDKLNHLRELNLGLFEYSTLEPNKETWTRHILVSPSLQVVHIRGSSLVLNSLGSLTTSWLSYSATDSFPEPTLETIRVSGRDWPSLETLDVRTDPGFENLRIKHRISVMSLRRLSLSSRSIVTTMIHRLAMHPSEFPLLDTLELGSCPEWDILFIMLEKRLLGQTTGAKPIETILFPRVIPTRIKRSLALLLAGYIVSRPSNYELSLQGNLDIFLDIDIPGCVECHLYLHACDTPAKGTTPDYPIPLATYPATADEILRTYPTRYEQTESIYPSAAESEKYHREMDCMWSKETIEISRYSID